MGVVRPVGEAISDHLAPVEKVPAMQTLVFSL